VLDLVSALHWVRDNVEHFGGDPSKVTIFGESGGGGKVSALLAMPAAHGLFHRAVIQSGASGRTRSRKWC
jgi:para-nitrobenzyl esterase